VSFAAGRRSPSGFLAFTRPSGATAVASLPRGPRRYAAPRHRPWPNGQRLRSVRFAPVAPVPFGDSTPGGRVAARVGLRPPAAIRPRRALRACSALIAREMLGPRARALRFLVASGSPRPLAEGSGWLGWTPRPRLRRPPRFAAPPFPLFFRLRLLLLFRQTILSRPSRTLVRQLLVRRVPGH
jgi:hypothetical protein